MTTYYVQQDEKIVLFDTDRQRLANTLNLMPQYSGLEVLETERPVENFEFADTEEYVQAQAQRERERLNLLNLTKADVLLALYEDKGITPETIKKILEENIPALIKFDYASSYYRGDELVNSMGLALGYSAEEIDYLFENKKFPPRTEDSGEGTENTESFGDETEDACEAFDSDSSADDTEDGGAIGDMDFFFQNEDDN